MPGPLLAITIGASARYGFWAGPLLILGHGILELALVVALVLGLSQFIGGDLPMSIVGLIGGVVLVVMGTNTARQGWNKMPMPTASSKSQIQNKAMVLSGIVGSMSNPYWFIWWATIGMTYLLWALKIGTAGVVSFFTGHVLADLVWYTLISFIIASGKRIMNDTVYDGLLLVCGSMLVVLGGYFIVSGVRFLTG